MAPKLEQSFGVIPLRKGPQGWEVFLIQHAKSRYWGFPKGHSETGESPAEAAVRELKEETNLDVIQYLQQEPLQEQYQFRVDGRQVFKKVFYFVAEVTGEVKLQMHEVKDGKWVSFSDAIHQVTHTEGKSILAQVKTILSEV